MINANKSKGKKFNNAASVDGELCSGQVALLRNIRKAFLGWENEKGKAGTFVATLTQSPQASATPKKIISL